MSVPLVNVVGDARVASDARPVKIAVEPKPGFSARR
jgi:hypothetical protein